MKTLVATALLATLVASPAFAQSYDPDVGTGNIVQWNDSTAYSSGVSAGAHRAFAQVPPRGAASPYMAYGAVTPFDTPAGARSGGPRTNSAREAALRECAPMSRRYLEGTWGTMQMQQYRTCMAQHDQME